MIDYAKIDKMLQYQKELVWPLLTENHNVFRYGTRGWEYPWVFEQLEGVKKGSCILDAGCGTTDFLDQLCWREFEVTGLDFFVDEDDPNKGYGLRPSYIQKYKDNINFLNGSMSQIPATDNSYDVVTCISVMEHIVIEHQSNPIFHLRCLDELKRVLKPGGLLICTYDTILSKDVMFANTNGWGPNGWYYLDDIDYLDMSLSEPSCEKVMYENISKDSNAFFIPPDIFIKDGYGNGFSLSSAYHRFTSIGFVLVK